jgi:hypothetical protein
MATCDFAALNHEPQRISFGEASRVVVDPSKRP